MKTIDINTSQNVTIKYEVATPISRILGAVLDLAIVFFYILIVSMAISSFMVGGDVFDNDSVDLLIVVAYVLFIPGFFYCFLCESLLGGQTVGKMAMGIRVLKISGENPSMGDYFLRWIFRLIDIISSVGALGLVVCLSTDKSQRFGDLVANTVVIKLKSTNELSVTDVLKIQKKHSEPEYEPAYPLVTTFTDEDMLLIKNGLERLKSNPNESHKQFIISLAEKTSEKLRLSTMPDKKVKFLRKVLNDYIVLTRS